MKLRWAYRFLKRKGLSIRRISHHRQFIPREHSDIKTKFIKKVVEERKKLNIVYNEDYRINNMDETPSYLDMSFGTTIVLVIKISIFLLLEGKNIVFQ